MCRRSDGSHGADLLEVAAAVPTVWWAIILTHGMQSALDAELWSRIALLPVWFGWIVAVLASFQVVAATTDYDHVARWTWMVSVGWWSYITINFLLAPQLSTAPGVYASLTLLSAACYRRRGSPRVRR